MRDTQALTQALTSNAGAGSKVPAEPLARSVRDASAVDRQGQRMLPNGKVYVPVKDRVSPGPSDYVWNVQPSKRSPKYYSMRPRNYQQTTWIKNQEINSNQGNGVSSINETPSPQTIPDPTLQIKIQPLEKQTFAHTQRFGSTRHTGSPKAFGPSSVSIPMLFRGPSEVLSFDTSRFGVNGRFQGRAKGGYIGKSFNRFPHVGSFQQNSPAPDTHKPNVISDIYTQPHSKAQIFGLSRRSMSSGCV